MVGFDSDSRAIFLFGIENWEIQMGRSCPGEKKKEKRNSGKNCAWGSIVEPRARGPHPPLGKKRPGPWLVCCCTFSLSCLYNDELCLHEFAYVIETAQLHSTRRRAESCIGRENTTRSGESCPRLACRDRRSTRRRHSRRRRSTKPCRHGWCEKSC